MPKRHVFCYEGHYLGQFGLPEAGLIPDDVVSQMALVAIKVSCNEDWFFLVTQDVLSHLYKVPGDPSSGLLFAPDRETWGVAKFCMAARKKIVVFEPSGHRKVIWPFPQHELVRTKGKGDLVIYYRWDDGRPLKVRATITNVHRGGCYSLMLEEPVWEGESPEEPFVYANRHEVFDLSFMS